MPAPNRCTSGVLIPNRTAASKEKSPPRSAGRPADKGMNPGTRYLLAAVPNLKSSNAVTLSAFVQRRPQPDPPMWSSSSSM